MKSARSIKCDGQLKVTLSKNGIDVDGELSKGNLKVQIDDYNTIEKVTYNGKQLDVDNIDLKGMGIEGFKTINFKTT